MSQSLLAKEIAPPKKDEALGSCALIVVGVVGGIIASMLTGSDTAFWIILAAALCGSFVIGKRAYSRNRNKLGEAHSQWARQLICLRCGFKFGEDQTSLWDRSAIQPSSAPGEPKLATAAVSENKGYTVILCGVGLSRVRTISELTKVLKCTIREADYFVANAPQIIKTGLSQVEAENIQLKLERAGTVVDVRRDQP